MNKNKLSIVIYFSLVALFVAFYLVSVFVPALYQSHESLLTLGLLGLLTIVFLRGNDDINDLLKWGSIAMFMIVVFQVVVEMTGSHDIIFSSLIVKVIVHTLFGLAFILFSIGIHYRILDFKKSRILKKASFELNEAIILEYNQTTQKISFEFSKHFIQKYHIKTAKGSTNRDEFASWILAKDRKMIRDLKLANLEVALINAVLHIKFFKHLPVITIQVKGAYRLDHRVFFLGFDYSEFERLNLGKQVELQHRLNLIDNMQLGFAEHEMIYDENGTPINYRYLYVNDIFCEIAGLPREKLENKLVSEVYPYVSLERIRRYQPLFEGVDKLEFESHYPAEKASYQLRAYRSDEHKFVTLFQDISDLKVANDKLQYLVTHNNNGLLNYRGLTEQLSHLPLSNEAYCFYYTIDNSDDIKTFYGNDFMNAILDKIAEELSIYQDKFLVAHTSFNHFIIVMVNPNKEDINNMFIETNKTIYRSYEIFGREINVKKNIGYAMIKNSNDYFELLRKAEIANINASDQVHNDLVSFNNEFALELKTNAKTAQYLYDAIKNDEMDIYFQRIVNGRTGDVQYLEALARWTNNELGFVPPSKFFELAMKADMIDFLDDYIIVKTLKEYKRYLMRSIQRPNLSMNVSSTSLLRPNYDLFILNEVVRQGLLPEQIVIEISEDTFIQDINKITERIKRFRSYGFKIAIDDFGSKYSSIGIIDMVPFDIIKLDGLFADRINSKTISTFVKTITDLAIAYNKTIVIEKIETQEQVDKFIALGCYMHQGFLYHKPQRL